VLKVRGICAGASFNVTAMSVYDDADIHEQLWQPQAKRVREANELLDGRDVHASFDFGESRTGDTGARETSAWSTHFVHEEIADACRTTWFCRSFSSSSSSHGRGGEVITNPGQKRTYAIYTQTCHMPELTTEFRNE